MESAMRLLQEGVNEGWQTGAQLYVSHDGKVSIDTSLGESRTGIAMRPDSIIQWYSAGKPLTAVAIAQLFERGELDLNVPVCQYIPEFANGGKEKITTWHLLTHTAGIRSADHIDPMLDWEPAIEKICETAIEPGWIPGQRAGYSTVAGWSILGELIRRISGMAFEKYIREHVLTRIGMNDSWLRLPKEKFEEYGERIAPMFTKSNHSREMAAYQDAEGMDVCRPGSSARGPIRDLGKFYEMLAKGGAVEGGRVLEERTVNYFTSRQREGMRDETFMARIDWGLGFLLMPRGGEPEKVPYGYGRFASASTFGHSGVQSSCGFADPENGLVAAWVCNCMPGARFHNKRHLSLNQAIYRDLGLERKVMKSLS
jgi:CubicO group peptidase (beta-lactamase class C family)